MALLLSSAEHLRYARQLKLPGFTEAAQLRLKQAHVLVIGAGGLGCPVLQYLAAAGIGTITLIDDDTVDVSNLQRQILFTSDDLGQAKVEVAAARLRRLNPMICVHPVQARFTAEYDPGAQQYDIVVDGTDNFSAKYAIDAWCRRREIPWVFGSIFQFTGQLAVFNTLQADGQRSPGLSDLFPVPPPGETSPTCSEAGVVGPVAGLIGSLQALEVIRMLTQFQPTFSGQVLIVDALRHDYSVFEFSRRMAMGQVRPPDAVAARVAPGDAEHEVSWQQAMAGLQQQHVVWVDVRGNAERAAMQPCELSVHIPLDQLPGRLDELAPYAAIFFFCRSGWRSKKALQYLRRKGSSVPAFSIKGGLDSYTASTLPADPIKCRL